MQHYFDLYQEQLFQIVGDRLQLRDFD